VPPEGSGAVAAFDFDGTLSRRDTLVPFLIGLRGRQAFARAAARSLGSIRGPNRNQAKASLLRHLVADLPVADYRDRAQAYGHLLPDRLRPAVVARLRAHQDLGHTVVIVSASLRDFLEPVVTHLGADDLIATELDVSADGMLTGELARPNVRGVEKVRRLYDHLGGEPSELWAYGNSRGDRALLESSDHPIWVRTGRRLPDLTR
jgi:phosphatidylglycerophosphatase C